MALARSYYQSKLQFCKLGLGHQFYRIYKINQDYHVNHV
jgi:hypothetical protein